MENVDASGVVRVASRVESKGAHSVWVHEIGWFTYRASPRAAAFIVAILRGLQGPADQCVMCSYEDGGGDAPTLTGAFSGIRKSFRRGPWFKKYELEWRAEVVAMSASKLLPAWSSGSNDSLIWVFGQSEQILGFLNVNYVDDVEANPDNEFALLSGSICETVASRGWDGLTLRVYSSVIDTDRLVAILENALSLTSGWKIELVPVMLS